MIAVSACAENAAGRRTFRGSRSENFMSAARLVQVAIGVAIVASLMLAATCGAYAIVVTDNFSDGTDGSAGTTTSPTPSPPNVSGPVWSRLDDEIVSSGQTWDASTGEYRLTAQNNGINLSNLGNVGFAAGNIASTSF